MMTRALVLLLLLLPCIADAGLRKTFVTGALVLPSGASPTSVTIKLVPSTTFSVTGTVAGERFEVLPSVTYSVTVASNLAMYVVPNTGSGNVPDNTTYSAEITAGREKIYQTWFVGTSTTPVTVSNVVLNTTMTVTPTDAMPRAGGTFTGPVQLAGATQKGPLNWPPQSAQPSTATAGDTYIDSDDWSLYIYNGAAWVSASISSAFGAISGLGTATSNGVATTAARSDHVHAAPSVTVNSSAHGATTTLKLNGPFASTTTGGTTNVTVSTALDRNVIINGDPVVAQRATSFATIANGAYALDRWQYIKVGAMVHTVSQSSDVPTVAQAGVRLQNSILVDCTTTDASIAAGDVCEIRQKVEGHRWVQIDQQPAVLSFWVKATQTGTYCVSLINSGADRSCVGTYTISGADTWEYKQITFPANPTAGTWNYTTGIGIHVGFSLACGSTFQTTAGAYASGEFHATSAQVNACSSTSNDFRITGVQLEAGTVATPYQTVAFSEQLRRSQRYHCKSFSYAQAEVQNSGTFAGAFGICAVAANTSGIQNTILFPAEMRVAPTITFYSPNAATANYAGTGTPGANVGAGPGTGSFVIGVAVAPTADSAYYIHWSADAEL